MSVDAFTFRHALIEALKNTEGTFDLSLLRNGYDVSDDVVEQATRAVFLSQCLRSGSNDLDSGNEQHILSELGGLLEITPEQQKEYIDFTQKHRVFETELEQARADGLITDEEAASLHELRQSLGLPTIAKRRFRPMKRLPLKRYRRTRFQKRDRRTPVRAKPDQSLRTDFFNWTPVFLLGLVSCTVASFFVESRPFQIAGVCVVLVCCLGLHWMHGRCEHCGGHSCCEITDTEERPGPLWSTTTFELHTCKRCRHQSWKEALDGNSG